MLDPIGFFLNQIQRDQIFEKEICEAKHEYMNIQPLSELQCRYAPNWAYAFVKETITVAQTECFR